MGNHVDLRTLEFNINNTLCLAKQPESSSGFWLGDDPLRATLPLLMLQLSMIVICCRAAHSLLRRIGQVEATSQIIVGFLLSPSVAGRNTWYRHTFFPKRSWMHLITVSELGYYMFVFLVGVKSDFPQLLKSRRTPMAVGLAGTIVPMGLVFLVKYTLRDSIPEELTRVVNDVAMRWCMTSFSVISHTLTELRLLNSAVGRIAMSASLLSTFVFSVALSMYAGVKMGRRVNNRLLGVFIASSQLALAVLAVVATRAVTLWIVKKTPAGQPLRERHFVAVLVMVLGCAMLYEVLGFHASGGMFFAGLALPSGPPLGATMVRRLETLMSDLFFPAFLALGGLRVDISAVTDGKQLAYMLLFLGLTVLGKFVGVIAPAVYSGMPLREAFSLAMVMNLRGIREVEVLNSWQDRGIVSNQTYATGLFFVVVSSAIGTPLLKLVYKPSATYAASDGRTVQYSGDDAELRVLACVHNEEDVAPIADVLQALRPGATTGKATNSRGRPIHIYILHLVQLVGRAAAVLAPHRKFKNHDTDQGADHTDHIVDAFRHIEQATHSEVDPFVSICPYASMHLDICALAMEKKSALVILPFHKRMAIQGAIEVAHAAHREVNVSVLSYAPCSVGILVSPRPSKGPVGAVVVPSRYDDARLSVGVYFLGGPDDREALCLAACMAANPNVDLTLVRFQLPAGSVVDAPEERLDDKLVAEFLQGNAANERVAHCLAVVRDGEEMVGFIRKIGDQFNFVILGRRQGVESAMTAGMGQWSQYPELGLLGDMIASTDMGGAATLVVQQSRSGLDK